MKYWITGAALLALTACSAEQTDTQAIDVARAEPVTTEDRFAILALDCVHREYPNKISHVLQSDGDAKTPRELTPAFYGCFDWHSSVHGQWLLSRILSTQPDSPLEPEIRAKLARSFTKANLEAELAYYTAAGRGSFERPYGIAWFLQLVLELEESDDPQMTEWRETLRPLEDAIVDQVSGWLPKLSYPIRLGTHNQSAFAFGLMLDYARGVGNEELAAQLEAKTLAFHRDDVNCPLSYEPSGEDFLSPCLMEADLMRRVMDQAKFAAWLSAFLPDIPTDGSADWLEPGVVLDASDGKLVHLDGVNLSRAWALEGIASALPQSDARLPALQAAADVHRETGIAAVSDEHYSGSHWLASFATYLTTKRGISASE
ncbi:MAG: DUF2891 domain-containing protein [Pseudomonadota bacterium]|nr:DUF2891 domain-containing protein [Pseudomonadota bacterium]